MCYNISLRYCFKGIESESSLRPLSWLSLLLVASAFSCSDVHQEESREGLRPRTTTEERPETKPSDLHVKIDLDAPLDGRSDVVFMFAGGYRNDDVIVQVEGRPLFHDILHTDNRVGFASEIRLPRKYHGVSIVVNGKWAWIEVPVGFSFCLVDKVSDTLLMHFTNVEPRFR